MTRIKPLALGATAVLSGSLAVGIHLALDPSPTAPSAPAAQAVTALVTSSPAAAAHALPPSFASVNGYRPRLDDGHLVDPTGGCSSPIPLPHEFGPICRQHDLGYDLLRTAAAGGHTLPASARREVDHQFAAETHRSCDDRTGLSFSTCTAMADVATGAVELNSWRQHWSSPGQESPVSVTAIVAAVIALLSALGLIVLGARELVVRIRRSFRTSPHLPEGARA